MKKLVLILAIAAFTSLAAFAEETTGTTGTTGTGNGTATTTAKPGDTTAAQEAGKMISNEKPMTVAKKKKAKKHKKGHHAH